ncbi:hypothetical protein BGM19_01995 [Streptomyces agglomeratus]|nr:hypothetical protein BGM19_01995 [Streptomyces agglomeratus]
MADALIRHAVTGLPVRRVEAFQFASALSLGLEALLVGHRPVTVRALERAGFTGQRLWRYMRADLPAPTLPRLPHVHIGPDPGDSSRRGRVGVPTLRCSTAGRRRRRTGRLISLRGLP